VTENEYKQKLAKNFDARSHDYDMDGMHGRLPVLRQHCRHVGLALRRHRGIAERRHATRLFARLMSMPDIARRPSAPIADHAISILVGDAAGLHDRVGGGCRRERFNPGCVETLHRCFVSISSLK
jgi:hypothetical protein